MELASPGMGFTILMFLVVLTVIVFVHEMGHYLTARLFKVRVEVFSVGFGRELFGWNDSHGTRWRVSALPFGGYVKFFGDQGVASAPDSAAAQRMSAEDRAVSFHFKPVWQRALIVAAGPLINILLAVLIYAGLFATLGQAVTPPRVTAVVEGSPADSAGFQPGDVITALDGEAIDRFEAVARHISMLPERHVEVTVLRDGREQFISVVPDRVEIQDRFGNRYEIGRVGIQGTEQQIVEHNLASAMAAAAHETVAVVEMMATTLWDMVLGKRSIDELGGPVRIAKMSGEQASLGAIVLISFIALISVNLGFVNLLPVPMLDGGHLAFYAFEAVRGRPLSMKVQEFATMAGLMLVFSLFVFLTWNDLANIGVWDRLSNLFS